MNIEGLIIDLDGVLTKDKALNPFDDTNYFINYINEKKIPYKIATNNTLYSPENLETRLKQNGINIKENSLITPLFVAPKFMKSKNIKNIFVIGLKELANFFKEKGFNVKNAINVDAVIIGQDKNLNFRKLKIATSAIKQNRAKILALNANLITKDDDGLVFPGVGSIAQMLAYSTKTDWRHFGKNSDEYNKELFRGFKNLSNVAIISDDIFTDLIPFSKLGLKTIFITTGKYKEEDIPLDFNPDYIVNSLREIILRKIV